MKTKLSTKKIVLVTHYLIYSGSQALRDFLRSKNCKKLTFIAHPLPINESETKQDRSFVELSKKNKIVSRSNVGLRFGNLLLSTLHEVFLNFYWILKTKEKYDLFIGVDNLNALQGIVLKKLGVVNKVVYYTIDYFPKRFSNQLLNKIYHFIDKFCVKYADETWNVSSEMASARGKTNKMQGKDYARQYEVPIGIWFDKRKIKSIEKIDIHKMIFVGHLLPYMGVDLVLKSMVKLSRSIKDIKLDIIGGGEDENRLKQLVKKYKLDKRVTFYGWVRDRNKLEQMLSGGAVGLALFNTKILDAKVKNADPAKIKDYMLSGMPVITTDALRSSQKIVDAKAGLCVRYDENDFIQAVKTLMKNKKSLANYRYNAISYVKKFDWANLFSKPLERVLS